MEKFTDTNLFTLFNGGKLTSSEYAKCTFIIINIEREREKALQSASDALYLYLLQAVYTRSTFNSDTQMVVV